MLFVILIFDINVLILVSFKVILYIQYFFFF